MAGRRGCAVTAALHCGDALTVLRSLPAGAALVGAGGVARCCVTSPPYWGLRDYGVAGQLGLEPTPDAYVARMVEVFAEVRRVLADDGTLWLNLGDSYNGYMANQRATSISENNQHARPKFESGHGKRTVDLKAKDMVGIPWRLAFALQADGWYLRSDIIWSKPNPMPESVTDRPTKAHEYVFLLSKRAKYYYDTGAIAEPGNPENWRDSPTSRRGNANRDAKLWSARGQVSCDTRNARSVWAIATQPYPDAHFATFPEELARRCILAGSAPGDTVLDPFGGSGTVAQVATGNGRSAIHIDLNPAYIEMARQRIGPMLCEGAA